MRYGTDRTARGAESRTPEANRYEVIDDKAHAGQSSQAILDLVEASAERAPQRKDARPDARR